MPAETVETNGNFQRKSISAVITFVILFMAAANGIFTYSGAFLYLEEVVYAVLFAVAVQFTIAAALIALPFVHGLGKLSLILVYTAALILSTLAAYTYIYNSSLPGNVNAYSIDTELKSKITNDLSDVVRAERTKTEQARATMQENKRLVDEEARNGGRSGLGPGKGVKYYTKLDAYEASKDQYNRYKKNLEKAQSHLNKINIMLIDSSGDMSRDKLLVEFSGLRGSVNSEESQDLIEGISKTYLGNLQNPVERSITALLDADSSSIQLIVSIIWAAVFDIVALFLGIVRYYLLRPDHSVLQGIYHSIADLFMFATRLKYLPQQVRLQYHKENGITKHDNHIPLNSAEMQTFATKLLMGSQLALPVDNDSAEPIKTLVGHIAPLDIEGDEQAIGIPFEVMEEETRLQTLIAMLVQCHVFLKHSEAESYVLNADEKYAQKVMVMIRMGMDDNPEAMSMVSFLLNNPEPLESPIGMDDISTDKRSLEPKVTRGD